jgi:hypothetical protein
MTPYGSDASRRCSSPLMFGWERNLGGRSRAAGRQERVRMCKGVVEIRPIPQRIRYHGCRSNFASAPALLKIPASKRTISTSSQAIGWWDTYTGLILPRLTGFGAFCPASFSQLKNVERRLPSKTPGQHCGMRGGRSCSERGAAKDHPAESFEDWREDALAGAVDLGVLHAACAGCIARDLSSAH